MEIFKVVESFLRKYSFSRTKISGEQVNFFLALPGTLNNK